MPDLMSGTWDYSTLETKYGNFVVPALKIKVNGVDVVKDLGLMVPEIQVMLSLKAAGAVIIKVADLYQEKNHTFRSDVKNKFKPGTVVEVELGYLSSTQKVFKGYVAMLGAEFGEIPYLVVTLMDARRLMMSSGKKQILHDVRNYSDAARSVLGNYSKLCTSVIDATSDALEEPVSQTTNDFDFITRELIGTGRMDREFFIVAEKAYVRKPGKVRTPMMKVRLGRELASLKVDFSYLDLKVEVIGYNPKKQDRVTASETAKGFLEQSRLLSQTPVLMAVDAGADSRDKASARAAAVSREKKEKTCLGSGALVGLPELVPGRFLQVEALEAMMNHKYYITEVTHVINGENFMTYFEIGGVC